MDKIEFRDYERNDKITSGKVVLADMVMEAFPDKRPRTIRVFLPEGYDGKKRFPVLYMHDGQNLFEGLDERVKWAPDRELKKIGMQAIIVGVDTSMKRFSELCPDYKVAISDHPLVREAPTGDLYARFIVEQLKPVIDANFAVLDGRENTGIGGSSMGGLMSQYMAMKYPEIFGRAMVFAPAYIAVEWDSAVKHMDACGWDRVKDTRFYIMAGGNEIERRLQTLRSSVRLYEYLMERGMDEKNVVLYTDSRLMHHEKSWNETFGDAFRFLFG